MIPKEVFRLAHQITFAAWCGGLLAGGIHGSLAAEGWR